MKQNITRGMKRFVYLTLLALSVWNGHRPTSAQVPASPGALQDRPAGYFQHVIFKDPTWEPSRLNLDAALARARTQDDGVSTTDPDLNAFVRRGGKLLLWHGWSDGAIAPLGTIVYYTDVMSTLGRVPGADQIRLFMAPGVQHCGGGEGPSQVDFFSVIEQWVEAGTAPDRLISSGRLGGTGTRTRPLCPYPQIATYLGQGNPDEAGSSSVRRRQRSTTQIDYRRQRSEAFRTRVVRLYGC